MYLIFLDFESFMFAGFIFGVLIIKYSKRFSKPDRVNQIYGIAAKSIGLFCIYIFTSSFPLFLSLLFAKKILMLNIFYLNKKLDSILGFFNKIDI
jgi:hypothetical protein